MISKYWALEWASLLVLVSVAGGCGGPQGKPDASLAAPEYERPPLAPWDAGSGGQVSDPIDDLGEGEWLDEEDDEDVEEESSPEAEPPATDASDAGAPDASTPDGG